MMHKMPRQLDGSNSRKRKSSSEVKRSNKESATRSTCNTGLPAESSSLVSSNSKAASTGKTRTRISCECHQAAGRRRCSASPELDGQEGKENEPRAGLDLDRSYVNNIQDKQEHEEMDYDETGKNIYPDDDSNQILPVEQFFGNLDIVQDIPQGSSATSAHARRENGRRHFYAQEDSDEDVCLDGTQQEG